MTETPTQSRPIASAAELVSVVELVGVMFYEIRAKRAITDAQVDVLGPVWGFAERHDESQLECRFHMTMTTEQADFFSDLGVVYDFSEPVVLSASAVTEFIEKVAIMAAFPFVRESIFTSAIRLGVPAPVMGLLKQGNFRLEAAASDQLESQPALALE